MPSPLRNGNLPVPSPHHHHHHHHHFQSTVSAQKLRRLNTLVLILRFASFCFSLASAIFMSTNSSRSTGSPSWLHFPSFRFVFAANAISALYSLFEMGSSIWEILRSSTLLPEPLQLWFDFGHDQVFGYMVLAAGAAGVEAIRGLKSGRTCDAENSLCVQAIIAVALGFVGFAFLALAALISGFRLACFLITGSRFHL
ncbi:CASP-like protein 4C1 [Dioscorea cayenensis subsp. rotundata]|uniref:CASP-like protein n=1 Tax=Dioscorea cayennensis subsp. rotundata TaxID=55577 RepID=A0AB40CXU9_DIOCR|nr:CASP-like protein 4C1 [Dioscorea cayenensis subsp. rotundata]